ncbi:class I SAM-dependent methyltransferase [Streptomyces sp. NPDC050095]|uniref:class I SAM-dependent methyltransferase n=1 Tax=unclassified Streptomyces TaxID=2593676 RepID=UPI0034353146
MRVTSAGRSSSNAWASDAPTSTYSADASSTAHEPADVTRSPTEPQFAIARSARRTSVETDLRDPEWPQTLHEAGWNEQAATMWCIECLLYYLHPHESDALIDTVSGLAATDSMLVLDVPHAEFLFADSTHEYRRYLAARTSPYLTGVPDVTRWLSNKGWHAEAFQPQSLPQCPWLPSPPQRLLDYQHVWHAIARRGGRP